MSALNSLKKFFYPADSTIALSNDPFIVIDRDKALAKLKLDVRAEANGKINYPQIEAETFDDVEMEIIYDITEHATRAQIDAASNHQHYSERLSELALLRELSTLKLASAQALGDFKATVIIRKGRLTLAKESIRESYTELAAYKHEHGLKRPAHRGIHPAYVWSTWTSQNSVDIQ